MFSEKIKRAINYFSRGEKALWLCSVALIAAAFLANDIYGFCSWRKMQRLQSQ